MIGVPPNETEEERRKRLEREMLMQAAVPQNDPIQSEGGEIQTNPTPRPLNGGLPDPVRPSEIKEVPGRSLAVAPDAGSQPSSTTVPGSNTPLAAPPPLSGYIPTNYSGQERSDYVSNLARGKMDLPGDATAQDRRGYEYARRTTPDGKFIDKDKGKGSAVKNFFKGLGLGFLRGGLGGAIAGGIMNTARGNMDEEFAWETMHRPRLDNAVAMENEGLAQQYAAEDAQRKAVAGQVDLRGKILNQANTESIIRDRERKAGLPDWKTEERNGIMFRYDANDPESEWAPVEALGVEKGKQYKQRKIQNEELWVTDAQYADYLKAEAAEKAKIEGEIRKENRDIRMEQYKFKLRMALEEYNDTVARLKSEQDFNRRAQLQTQAERARERLARIRQEANDLE